MGTDPGIAWARIPELHGHGSQNYMGTDRGIARWDVPPGMQGVLAMGMSRNIRRGVALFLLSLLGSIGKGAVNIPCLPEHIRHVSDRAVKEEERGREIEERPYVGMGLRSGCVGRACRMTALCVWDCLVAGGYEGDTR